MNDVQLHEKLKSHKHIIFGSDHYNTLGVVRSLGEKGITPILILHPHYRQKPVLSNNSKYIGDVYIVKDEVEGLNLLINKYGNESLKPFVYSCDDWVSTILDANMEKLDNRFYFFHGKQAGIVANYMDKKKIKELALECGFAVAKSERVKKGILPETLKYPVITKSLMSTIGGWKSDVHVCHNKEELLEAYETIESDDLLIEEYLERETEYYYDGFASEGGKKIVLPFKATCLRAAEGEYGNYLLFSPTTEYDVVEKVTNMIKRIGYTGVFEVEFLYSKDHILYLLEINFRNSTWSYPMTFAGMNLLYHWALSELKGQLCLDGSSVRETSFVALVEIKDFRDFVLSGKVSFFTWIKQLFTADCLFYFNKKDIKPIIYYIFQVIGNRLNFLSN